MEMFSGASCIFSFGSLQDVTAYNINNHIKIFFLPQIGGLRTPPSS